MINGFALIDKPGGWTSHDVVARLRRLYGQRRIGHAGTLDPMATGVLVVGLGSATRLLRFVQGQSKTYEATIRLGEATDTDDAQGEVISAPGWSLDRGALRDAMASLTGHIEQVPSAVSAVKIDGKRAYAKVRAGESVHLPARAIEVSRFEILAEPRPAPPVVDVDVVVQCSSGTYVRALARDLGAGLDSAGHLTHLRRTGIGAITVDMCTDLTDDPPPVHSIEDIIGRLMAVVVADEELAADLRHGRPVRHVLPDGLHLVVDARQRWVSVVTVNQGSVRVEVNAPTPVEEVSGDLAR